MIAVEVQPGTEKIPVAIGNAVSETALKHVGAYPYGTARLPPAHLAVGIPPRLVIVAHPVVAPLPEIRRRQHPRRAPAAVLRRHLVYRSPLAAAQRVHRLAADAASCVVPPRDVVDHGIGTFISRSRRVVILYAYDVLGAHGRQFAAAHLHAVDAQPHVSAAHYADFSRQLVHVDARQLHLPQQVHAVGGRAHLLTVGNHQPAVVAPYHPRPPHNNLAQRRLLIDDAVRHISNAAAIECDAVRHIFRLPRRHSSGREDSRCPHYKYLLHKNQISFVLP